MLELTLPPGAYATVLLAEVTKGSRRRSARRVHGLHRAFATEPPSLRVSTSIAALRITLPQTRTGPSCILPERFLAFTLLGAEWVLWLLIALSIVSFAIMIERAWFFLTHRVDVDSLGAELRRLLAKGNVGDARSRVKGSDSAEMTVVAAGLDEVERGVDAVAEAMVGAKARERMRLERNLAFLGTLGNNAPFIGLFGTVLGIIRPSTISSGNQAGGVAVGHGRHLRGARRHRGRPHGRHPGRRRLQLLQPARARRRSPTSTRWRTWCSRSSRAKATRRRRQAEAPRRSNGRQRPRYEDDEGGAGAITDINVTPLVDITLVLLIIFMVTAPMIVNNPSIKVELPKAATGDETLKSTLALTLQREASGGYSLYANGEKTDETDGARR